MLNVVMHSVIMLGVIMLSRFDECRYAECRGQLKFIKLERWKVEKEIVTMCPTV
jgi:hypothetical protein